MSDNNFKCVLINMEHLLYTKLLKIKLSLIELFRIGPFTGHWLAVLVYAFWPWVNTANLGPVTKPIKKIYLISFTIVRLMLILLCVFLYLLILDAAKSRMC